MAGSPIDDGVGIDVDAGVVVYGANDEMEVSVADGRVDCV